MCTGFSTEASQNDLYLKTRELGGKFFRDKDSNKYNVQTTHLLVGVIAKSEKFLSALAAGIPMLDVSFLKDSSKRNAWIEDVDKYDIGDENSTLKSEKIFVKPLKERRKIKADGGVFKRWNCVVVLDNVKLQEVYRRILELGGATVQKWTAKHLADLDFNSLKNITHVFCHPNLLLNDDFKSFLSMNDRECKIPTLAYIYIGDYLIKCAMPPMQLYDVRQDTMIGLLTEEPWTERLKNLQLNPPDEINSPRFSPIHEPSNFTQPTRDVNDNNDDLLDTIGDDLPEISLPDMSSIKNKNSKKRGAPEVLSKEVTKKAKSRADPKKKIDEVTIDDEDDLSEDNQGSNSLSHLKNLAQSFMNSPGPSNSSQLSQSRLTSWISQKPSTSSQHVEEKEIICLNEDRPMSQDPPTSVRRGEKSKSNVPFLSQKRSGSTKTGSARSLQFFSQESNDSLTVDGDTNMSSQDSYLSDGGDISLSKVPFDINTIASTPAKQKMYLIDHLLVQNKLFVDRLDVGDTGVPILFPEPETHPAQLSALTCMYMWTCLESEDEMQDMEREFDIGWLEALKVLKDNINAENYLPPAAMNKIMKDAMRNHGEAPTRADAYRSLMHCINFHPPGPQSENNLRMKDLYLEVFSFATPHVGKWVFDPLEPWHYIKENIEDLLNEGMDTTNSTIDSDNDAFLDNNIKLVDDGKTKVLKFFTFICEIDLKNWFEHCLSNNKSNFTYKPFLACVLCPVDNISISKNTQSLIKLFIKSITCDQTGEVAIHLRKLVGLTAQMLHNFKDRIDKSGKNKLKLQFAKDLAFDVLQANLPADQLWSELTVMEPSWLSALVSRELLSISNNLRLPDIHSMRDIITQFVDMKITVVNDVDDDQKEAKDEEEEMINFAEMITSTPMTRTRSKANKCTPSRRSVNNNVLKESCSPSNTPVKPSIKKESSIKKEATICNSPSQATQTISKTPKIKVNQQNKYGETPVHIAAKRGNLVRLRECLNTPGVDINCADYNGFTPLSEAVSKNRLEAVELLLNHTTKSLPITRFFTPTKGGAGTSNRKLRVDLLKQNDDDKKNPFHEAVDNNNLKIARVFLETLRQEESKPHSGLPSVETLLSTKTGNDETVLSLVKSEEMKELLEEFSSNVEKKEVIAEAKKEESIKLEVNETASCKVKLEHDDDKENLSSETGVVIRNGLKFNVMLELSFVKYCRANSVDKAYKLFKETSVEDLLEATQDDFKPNTSNAIQFLGGFNPVIFNSRKPNFELHRENVAKSQDMRDFEKLVKFEELLPNVTLEHPLYNLVKSMKK